MKEMKQKEGDQLKEEDIKLRQLEAKKGKKQEKLNVPKK